MQDGPFQGDSIIIVLEGIKKLVLLPRYPDGGVLIPAGGPRSQKVQTATKLHNDSCLPQPGSLERLAVAFGDEVVLSLGPGSCVVVPSGMHHAAINLGRCVSLNTTYLPLTPVDTLVALDRTIVWFNRVNDASTKMGDGFRLWVEDVAKLFLRELGAAHVSVGADGYDVYCCKVGYVYELARIVERMVGIGGTVSSKMNAEWRCSVASHLRDSAVAAQMGPLVVVK